MGLLFCGAGLGLCFEGVVRIMGFVLVVVFSTSNRGPCCIDARVLVWLKSILWGLLEVIGKVFDVAAELCPTFC